MKKLLAIVGGILVLLIVVAVAVPFLVPTETYKNQVQKQVQAATGRDLSIAGDVGFSLLPSTTLTVNKLALSNPEWAQEDYLARLDSLKVKVDPWALFGGELKVQSFVLQNPVIQLEIGKDGTPSWQFGTSDGAEASGDGGGGGSMPLQDITLKDVRLANGEVVYFDARSGVRHRVTNVNASLALQTLDGPFSADGSLAYNGETLDVALDTGPPRGLLAGKPTDVTLSLESEPITLSYDGSVTQGSPQKLEGEIDVAIPSMQNLAAWAGQPLDASEDTFQTFELAGSVKGTGQRYSFDADRIVFDKIEGNGELGVDLGGPKPSVAGELNLARLDVTPYMPPPTEPATDGADGGGGDDSAPPPRTEWSDAPIDVSALGMANVDFDLSVESIKAREIEVGKSALSVRLLEGELVADLTELRLYEGRGTGRVRVDSRPDVPAFNMVFDLKDVAARPLLADAAGFERLEGTGNIRFDVTGKGRSQKAIVNNLNGDGAVRFTDGAIVGLNLAKMVRNVGNAFTGDGGTQKTDFAELAGTFTIRDGVLRNDDLVMLNPLLRIRGEGMSDIAARTVDYRVTPKAVASLQGQGGDVTESGVAVPVIIEGPWHDIGYRPDLESVMKDVIKDPAKVKKSAKDALGKLKEGGGGIGDTLKGLTGSGGASEAGDAAGSSTSQGASQEGDGDGNVKDKVEDAKDKLKGLFE